MKIKAMKSFLVQCKHIYQQFYQQYHHLFDNNNKSTSKQRQQQQQYYLDSSECLHHLRLRKLLIHQQVNVNTNNKPKLYKSDSYQDTFLQNKKITSSNDGIMKKYLNKLMIIQIKRKDLL